MLCGSGQGTFEDVENLERDCEARESGLEATVRDLDGEQAKQDEDGVADVGYCFELCALCRTLDEGNDEVEREEGGEEAEEPGAAILEVVAEAVVLVDLVGIEERADEIEKGGVDGEEKVKREGPLRDASEGELPPPKVDEIEDEKERPGEMNPVDRNFWDVERCVRRRATDEPPRVPRSC